MKADCWRLLALHNRALQRIEAGVTSGRWKAFEALHRDDFDASDRFSESPDLHAYLLTAARSGSKDALALLDAISTRVLLTEQPLTPPLRAHLFQGLDAADELQTGAGPGRPPERRRHVYAAAIVHFLQLEGGGRKHA